jgi:hypothetical protein
MSARFAHFTKVLFLAVLLTGIQGCSTTSQYEIVMVPVYDEDWGALKYNTQTGETWRALRGVWIKILDSETLPPSLYKVEMVALDKEWGAIRVDTKTGKSWRAKNGKWLFMP